MSPARFVRCVSFDAFGDPSSVRLADLPERPLAAGEVRVAIEAAPLNPSDFLLLDGHYGIRPELPAVGGAEGVGVVTEVGEDTSRVAVGQRVLVVPSRIIGTWADEIVLPERRVVPVSRDADPVQLATVPINGATAKILLDEGASLPPGSWIAQTAANSGLGAFIRALAGRAGLRLVDVVRSRRAADALVAAGAAHVVSTDEPVEPQLAGILGDGELRLILDGVGGPTIDELLPRLGTGGRIAVFAALSGKPVVVPPRRLTFGDLGLRGFWLHHWLTAADQTAIDELFGELIDLVADGVLTTPVRATYGLDDVEKAIAEARSWGRDGKVFFTPGAG